MGIGIEVFNEFGQLVFETNMLPFKAAGQFQTTAGNGSIACPLPPGGGTFAYYSRPIGRPPEGIVGLNPVVTWSGGVATWTYPTQNMWDSQYVRYMPNTIYWGTQYV